MPEINLFNGGMNIHKDPKKLESNECIHIADAEITSGSIRSLNEATNITNNVSPIVTYYKNRVVSGSGDYLKFTNSLNYLIKSDGVLPMYSVGKRDENDRLSWLPLQVTEPEIKPTIDRLSLTMDVTLTGLVTEGTSAIRLYKYIILLDDIPHEFNYECGTENKIINLHLDTISSTVVPSPTTIVVYRQTDIAVIDGCTSPTNLVTNININLCQDTLRPTYDNAYVDRVKSISLRTFYDPTITWSSDGTAKIGIKLTSSTLNLNFITGTCPASGTYLKSFRVFEHTWYPNNHDWVYIQMKGKRKIGLHWVFTLEIYFRQDDWTGTKYYGTFKCDVSFTGYSLYSFAYTDGYGVYFPDSYIDSHWSTGPNVVSWDEVWEASSASTSLTSTRLSTTLTGDFQYALTYETSTGVETNSGEYTDIISSIGSSILVDVPAIASPPAGTVTVNLYRYNSNLCGGQTWFLRVDEIAIGDLPITITDYTGVDELGVHMPRDTAKPVPLDLLFITSYKGRVFAVTKDYHFTEDEYAPVVDDEYPTGPWYYGTVWTSDNQYTYTVGDLIGQTIEIGGLILYRDGMWELIDPGYQNLNDYTTLRWSNMGNPLVWDATNFLNMDKVITGIGTTGNGLLVMHTTETHALLGTETNNFTKRIISKSQGCIDFRSISEFHGNCIFGSIEGISMSNGGTVELISYNKLGPLLLSKYAFDDIYNVSKSEILSSAVVGNQYFLLMKDGYLLKLDISTGVYSTITASEMLGITAINGALVGAQTNQELYRIYFDESGAKTYSITTGELTEGALTNLKEYDKVRVALTGTGSITVNINGKSVLENKTLVEPLAEIGIPNEHNKGTSIQFIVSGIGELHSIEYSVRGRENG